MTECRSCGASIDYRAAFCSKCGELTRGGQPFGRELGAGLADLSNDFGKLAKWIIGYVTEEANRKRVIAGGVIITLLLIALTATLGGVDQSQPETDYVFPAWAQGEWSNKDHCPRQNSGDIYVVVEGANFYVNGYGARLTGISGNGGRSTYLLRSIEPGSDSESTVELKPSANGRSLTVVHVEPDDAGTWKLFEDGLPCSAIVQ